MGQVNASLRNRATLTLEEPEKKLVSTAPKPNEDELVLGMLCLGLCSLSYNNHELDPKKHEFEKYWTKQLKVVLSPNDFLSTDKDLKEKIQQPYRIWSDTIGNSILESQAITGFMYDVPGSPCPDRPVPFVCFRGSTSIFDFYRDLKSAKATLFYTSQGKVAGQCGAGFFEMLSELLKPFVVEQARATGAAAAMESTDNPIPPNNSNIPYSEEEHPTQRLIDVVLRNMSHTPENGLIICGHSLGGAVSTLFFTELLYDNPELIEKYQNVIRVVTFGSPRAVDLRLADKLDRSGVTHLRFVNDNDIVTAVPPRRMELFYHWGKCLFAPQYFYDQNNEKGKKGECAQSWIVMHDPKLVNFKPNPSTAEHFLNCEDFGVDRLHTHGLRQELLECLHDNFAAHFLTNIKGYAGQFLKAGSPHSQRLQALHQQLKYVAKDINADGIPDEDQSLPLPVAEVQVNDMKANRWQSMLKWSKHVVCQMWGDNPMLPTVILSTMMMLIVLQEPWNWNGISGCIGVTGARIFSMMRG